MTEAGTSAGGTPHGALLPRARYAALAEALGDTPHTAIDQTQIGLGRCRIWVAGELPGFHAAVVQIDDNPREVDGYGGDAAALDALLAQVPDWYCVLVAPPLAEPLAERLRARLGCHIRFYGDVAYLAPEDGLIRHTHPDVRLLTPADLPLQASPELQGKGFGGPAALLEQGYAAGALVDGALVALAHTCAITPRFGEIGAHCLEPFRRRGYVTAAAWLVAERLYAAGRRPVWSTGEDNWASQRVAIKLGFREIGRRVYLIPQRDSP